MRLPAMCSAVLLSLYSGTLPKLLSKPISNIILEQNTASFSVRAAALSSSSIVDCAVSPWSPTFKLIGALTSITIYDDVSPAVDEVDALVGIREGGKPEATLLVGSEEVCGPG